MSDVFSPKIYKCSGTGCNRSGCRLWRRDGIVFPGTRLLCANCLLRTVGRINGAELSLELLVIDQAGTLVYQGEVIAGYVPALLLSATEFFVPEFAPRELFDQWRELTT